MLSPAASSQAVIDGRAPNGLLIPAGFDPTTQVLAGLAAVPYAHDVSVVLHTSLAQARQRIPPSVGTLTEVNRRLTELVAFLECARE